MFSLDMINGDLYIAFAKDYNQNNAQIITIDNGTQFEFIDGELASIIFPEFERKLNRGELKADDLELFDIGMYPDDFLVANVGFDGQRIAIKVDCSELKKQNI